MKTIISLILLIIPLFGGQTQNQLNQVNKNFFIENKGQWPPEVKYLAKVGGMSAWITNTGIVYDDYQINRNYTQQQLMKMTPDKKYEFEKENTSIKGHVVKMRLVDVNTEAQQQGNNKQETYYNYFIGNDKAKWAPNVPLYGDIAMNEIYQGINVKYYFDQNSIRYDYIIKPGADLSNLRMKFDGQESIMVNDSGELVIKTSLGEVINGKLYSYQSDNGIKQEVNCGFNQNLDGTFSLNAKNYDKTKELVIDPLVYSTYLGGNNIDFPNSFAIDSSGNAYTVGWTFSSNFPVTLGAYDTTYLGDGQFYGNVFISKLNPTGTSLLYSTYLGGSFDNNGESIAIDYSGNTYITGYTGSTNFPVTPGAIQTIDSLATLAVAFITKLNPTGNALVYSTLFGNWGPTYGYSIAIDVQGNSYLTGWTGSKYFPVTPGAFQTANGPNGNAFITKLNPTGTAIVYSTLLGGNDANESAAGSSIAIDVQGNAYIAGTIQNTPSNFPVSIDAFQKTYGGGNDGFVTKLNSTGTALIYSTFLGGSGNEWCNSIAIDDKGNAYVTGSTLSSNFPVTLGAFQTTYHVADAFVTKLNPTGTALVYSTFLGGSMYDAGESIAVDIQGNAFIAGETDSPNFPISVGSYQTKFGGFADAYITKINPTGTALLYSTYFGGPGPEYAHAMVIDTHNNVYILGSTQGNIPTTPSAFQTIYGDSFKEDAFITKLQLGDLNSINDLSESKLTYTLNQNYPNPFNPDTKIRYTLPARSHVQLTVYNTLGQQVAQLVNGDIGAGSYEVLFNTKLSSGVYFYRIEAGQYTATKKMIILK